MLIATGVPCATDVMRWEDIGLGEMLLSAGLRLAKRLCWHPLYVAEGLTRRNGILINAQIWRFNLLRAR